KIKKLNIIINKISNNKDNIINKLEINNNLMSNIKIYELNNKNNLNKTLNFIDNCINPTEFEIFIGSIFEVLGYHINHVGKIGDGGIDLLISHEENGEGIVQVKHYNLNNRVSEPKFRDLWGVLCAKNKDYCFMVTNSYVTKAAINWPKQNNISNRFY